ncbi:hypothetical protein CcaverHIS002_0401360 [Cutaneotrichosporon cavernicola]|uniref:Mitochondrial import inner membrane translocase subunit TIM50 n=1 Tax=Cutaneotrichosporon cavernicola TaxID=279322 RepID=A0AA48L3L1_9TREE|nr:uncharacterized protein CcaverHIS019_0401320 [Cutaneotrichosporon cavernicola]BEI83532.1 hypothetical protein CcaverHIS002_0401360 [Cutaneotrichosporon cavernicola]BEI91312.1 hypothetical protein CcaverHIS019_0401320 [Cutaneotrichosporon cavernicola]BEI99085.1 hypothetical protein CcaverHIS631_0401280 [Cutaneotrichosporon cavernicola]BEJ06859.1 hypothetical protein CcaverHIS641_0401280 [Cutaneotrichosporon cavernicola]
MLRTSTVRLLAARNVPLMARPISRSAPAYIRIKKADGSTSKPDDVNTPKATSPPPPPEAPKQPSPAEQPASNPKDAKPTLATEPAPEPSKAAPSEPAAPVEEVDEIPDKPDLSKLPSLDIDPEANVPFIEQPKEGKEKEGDKKRAGGKKRPEYVSSIERQRRFMSRLGMVSLLIGGVGAAYYLGNQDGKEKGGNPLENFKNNVGELTDIFSKPAFTKLLPDPLPPPHQRPYTLLVDIEDLLVHSTWDRQNGWRTAKRPGVDYFLAYLSQFYEIVVFSAQPVYTALPVAEKLDPMTLYLPYKLFRDATRYVDGHIVKDLTYLNRDLSKVVMLDTNAEHASLQPDNAIILKPWNGSKGDRGLVEMIPFLESIGIFQPADVRPVLKHYAGKDIPREYAKKEAEAKDAAIAEWERNHPTGSGGGWSLSSVFGGSSSAPRPKQPMTYLEIKRQQAQRMYEEEQKYYKEHGAEIMKMIEEDKERQMAEMKAGIKGMFGMGGEHAPGAPSAGAPPAEQAQAQPAK